MRLKLFRTEEKYYKSVDFEVSFIEHAILTS